MTSSFPIVPTAVESSSEAYIKHKEEWKKVLEDHYSALRWCVSEGQEKYVQRHIERGMLLCIAHSRMFADYSEGQNKAATGPGYSIFRALHLCRL
jgi:hypothetical protein